MLKLSRINNTLVALIILINGYLVFAPLYPHFNLWWEQRHHQQQKLTEVIRSRKSPSNTSRPIPAGEWLTIPKIALNTQIFEGPNIYTANKGVWHRPQSSSPTAGGNTVLAGHRFTYTNPEGIFYNLDKIAVGDTIALAWNGKQYTYTVSETRVVPPSDVSVEAPTNDNRLTLYTCTPLWSPKNRLVIIALRSDHV